MLLAVTIIVAIAACASAAAVVIALWSARSRSAEADQRAADRLATLEAEAKTLNDDNARLARDLAVEREKSSRLPGLQSQLDNANQAFATARNENAGLIAEITGLNTQLVGERKQADEKLRILSEARDALTQQFKLLANEVLERHSDVFAKQNKEQIDVILQPLREKLAEFQQGLQSAHADSAKERATLGEQIRQLSESSAKMTLETSTLANALRGSSQTQGAWGEMILASILERSGLRAGEEYSIQESHTTEEGDRLRTDVIVHLPGGQRVIIDSKVSLVAFEAFTATAAEEERQQHLGRHLQSMRSHITGLGSKEYHAVAGSGMDYVVMFVPIEGALAAALQRDPALTTFAVQNNVAIATPTTLMIALRTIESVWKIERRNSNAEAIADRAGKMYDKFVNFIDDLTKLGSRLDQAQASYRAAYAKLSTGSGHLAGQFEKLRELGARTDKAIPPAMLGTEEGPDRT